MSGKQEIILEGVPASPGIVIAPCVLYTEPSWEPEPQEISRGAVKEQITTFRRSVEAVQNHLSAYYRQTLREYGKDLAEILELQTALLDDKIFLKEVEDFIREKRFDAPYATYVVFLKKKEHFLQMSNDYFRDRAVDVHSLKIRLIREMQGIDSLAGLKLQDSTILVADNLSPADTIHFHRQKLAGFATNMGGRTSHTAIVARSLNIPAVVGLANVTKELVSGQSLVLDGLRGQVILNPAESTLEKYHKELAEYSAFEESMMTDTREHALTIDGTRLYIQANIEFEDELDHVLHVGADGIGLFRTEGIFLSRDELPTTEEQYQMYRRIAERLHPENVIIRTLDIGGDKLLPGVFLADEDNPFLGWRAIRFWLDHQDGFVGQLKAILRANTNGNVQILLPMVSSLDELRQSRELLERASAELKQSGHEVNDNIDLGIMVEIPSAVMMADVFAREADFLSIGTNDLVQYTLAVDRGNEKVAKLYSHFHPAVLRMVDHTLKAGKDAAVPVGMCGEMAGDPLALPLLYAMGLEFLSINHYRIPEIKSMVRGLKHSDCVALYKCVIDMTQTSEVVHALKQFLEERFPDIYRQRELSK